MPTLKERKAALAASRDLFNGFAALFKPVSAQIFAIAEFKRVLEMFQAVADSANARSETLRTAIADEGGLDLVPPLSPAQEAKAKTLSDQMTVLFQAFEADTGLEIFSLTLERSADGKINAGDVTMLR